MLRQEPALTASLNTTVTSLSQASDALKSAADGMLSQETVTSVGTLSNTGATLSKMVILCVAVVAFPQLSVTVKVLIIAPPPVQSFPTFSFSSLTVIVTSLSQLSVAMTPTVLAVGTDSSQFKVMSAGTLVIVGEVLSRIVTT